MENTTVVKIKKPNYYYLVDIPYVLLDIPNFDNYKYDPKLHQVYNVHTKKALRSTSHWNDKSKQPALYSRMTNNNGEKKDVFLKDLIIEKKFKYNIALKSSQENWKLYWDKQKLKKLMEQNEIKKIKKLKNEFDNLE